MEIRKTAVAGTMESSDIMITLEAGENGIEIDLNSSVEKQYGDAIRRVILDALNELGVAAAKVTAVDRGALDCAIRARVRAAALRASGESYRWEGAKT